MSGRALMLVLGLGLGCGRDQVPVSIEPPVRASSSPAAIARVSPATGLEAEVPSTDHFVIVGGRAPGRGEVAVEILDGTIVAIGPAVGEGLPQVDVDGRVLVPALVDSHVHLSYRFGEQRDRGARRLAASGLAAVVDLGAPRRTLGHSAWPLRALASGPMLTAPGGYPTRGWGRDGYGVPAEGAAEVRAAVRALHEAGASVVKVALHGDPMLDGIELRAAVDEAHALGLRVVAHALGDAEARLAAAVGVDALAHTPLEPLRDETIEAWSDRAVISTLAAFGGGPVAVDNLRRLHEAGAVVLYGTDLGNPGLAATGISPEEIEGLAEAGLDGDEILAAATSVPARWWGLESIGSLEVGSAASLLVLDAWPRDDPTTLARPVAVILDGVESRLGE